MEVDFACFFSPRCSSGYRVLYWNSACPVCKSEHYDRSYDKYGRVDGITGIWFPMDEPDAQPQEVMTGHFVSHTPVEWAPPPMSSYENPVSAPTWSTLAGAYSALAVSSPQDQYPVTSTSQPPASGGQIQPQQSGTKYGGQPKKERCDPCNKKYPLVCDLNKPSCGTCVHRGELCTYGGIAMEGQQPRRSARCIPCDKTRRSCDKITPTCGTCRAKKMKCEYNPDKKGRKPKRKKESPASHLQQAKLPRFNPRPSYEDSCAACVEKNLECDKLIAGCENCEIAELKCEYPTQIIAPSGLHSSSLNQGQSMLDPPLASSSSQVEEDRPSPNRDRRPWCDQCRAAGKDEECDTSNEKHTCSRCSNLAIQCTMDGDPRKYPPPTCTKCRRMHLSCNKQWPKCRTCKNGECHYELDDRGLPPKKKKLPKEN